MKTLFPIRPLLPADEIRIRRGEVSMEQLKDGDHLLVYANHLRKSDAKGALEGDNAKANLYMQRLDRDGCPQGDEKLLIACPENVINIMSPAIRRLPDGRLGMVYSYRETLKKAERVFISSADEGESWSDPVTVAEGGYITGCHDRLLVTSSGRLLAPLHCTDDWDKHYLWVKVAFSDDLGVHWQCSNTVELPAVHWPDGRSGTESGCIEPGVCELADGRILLILRTGMGSIFYSLSSDGGTTFTKPLNLEVAAPCAPSCVKAMPDKSGTLLIWNDEYFADQTLGGGRHRLSMCFSDTGLDYPKKNRVCLIESPERAVDYPCFSFVGSEIWLLFRMRDQKAYGNVIESFMMKIPMSAIRK